MCGSSELSAVRNRGHGCKRSIHTSVTHWVQERAVVIRTCAATNHGLAFSKWIPNETQTRRDQNVAAMRQTAWSISSQSLQIRVGNIGVFRQNQSIVGIEISLSAC